MRSFAATAAVFLLPALLAAGCGPAPPPPPGSDIACGGESRKARDCSSEVSYQGTNVEGGFTVANLAGANAKHEQTALRRVDEETERFIAQQNQLCRDYNACAVSVDEYSRESREIRDKVGRIPAVKELIKNAKTDEDRKKVIDELYRSSVPDEKRSEEVTFRLGLEAILPDSVGGGTVQVEPLMPLPTNARVAFTVSVQPTAYVYIFQKAPNGGVTTLFPDERIGTKNPLEGGAMGRIPGGDMRFRLNDKDLGLENVYIAVSRKPVQRLDQALSRVSAGQVSRIGDDSLLKSFVSVAPSGESAPKSCTRALELDAPASEPGCRRSRGLELDTGAGAPSGATNSTFAVRTDPGDDLIVKVFCFDHLTEGDYLARVKAGGGKPARSRGTVVEE